jgi:hypothetical protein
MTSLQGDTQPHMMLYTKPRGAPPPAPPPQPPRFEYFKHESRSWFLQLLSKANIKLDYLTHGTLLVPIVTIPSERALLNRVLDKLSPAECANIVHGMFIPKLITTETLSNSNLSVLLPKNNSGILVSHYGDTEIYFNSFIRLQNVITITSQRDDESPISVMEINFPILP